MSDIEKHLENLSEIRSIMDKSSRFISLSGLAGVFAGLFALIGAGFAYRVLEINPIIKASYLYENGAGKLVVLNADSLFKLAIIAIVVLVASLGSGLFFTQKNAQKQNQSMFDSSSKNLLLSLFTPLVAGGFFCLILVHHGFYGLTAPGMLLFYGLALLNASKYTLVEIRYLAFSELILGLIAAVYIGYGLLFWSIGFGILHIAYGTIMYFKYEK